MDLDVISREPAQGRRSAPLLFVHGAYGAAWVWHAHFLDAFADRGWQVHAVNLRGHGPGGDLSTLLTARLSDYAEDVEQVAESLPARPILVGHSMGGLVVQSCLHRASYPAAVLMASPPPHGLVGTWIEMALFRSNLLMQLALMQTFGPAMADLSLIKRGLFSDAMDDEAVLRILPRFGLESPLAILDMLGPDPFGFKLPPSRPHLDLPVLVLAAEHDALVSSSASDETARTYRTRSEVMPGIGHAMMLDVGWDAVAERILAWLDALEPAPKLRVVQ